MEILKKIEILVINNDIENAYIEIVKNEEKYKNNSKYWNLKGILSLKVKEYYTAINCFNKSIMIDSSCDDVYYNLGYTYEKVGALSEAAIYYGIASRISKDIEMIKELDNKFNDSKFNNIYEVAKNLTKKTFIILSSCGWGEIYQRMHHISRSLHKFGNDVKYICPAMQISIENDISINQSVDISLNNVKEVEGVEIYQPLVGVKNNNQLWNNYTQVVQKLLDRSLNNNVIISYLPYQVEVIKKLNGDFYHIYECVDDHSDTKYAFWENKSSQIKEGELMNLADSITTTAVNLYLKKRVIENKDNVYLLKNAVNEMDFNFNEDQCIPEELLDIPEPRVVYSGAIYEWFDIDLFYKIVESNPDKSFVIIGFGKMELLKNMPQNLYVLGAKKHSDLKKYIKHMQAGIIPFKDSTNIIINCDPIKCYEYIACGIPVITTFMPECGDKINTHVSKGVKGFSDTLNRVLGNKKNYIETNRFICENSWNSRAAVLYSLSNRELDNKKVEIEIKKYISTLIKSLKSVDNNELILLMEAMYIESFETKECLDKFKDIYNKSSLNYVKNIYFRYLLDKDVTLLEESLLSDNYLNDIYKAEIKFLTLNNKLKEKELLFQLVTGDYIENNSLNEYERLIISSEILGENIELDLLINLLNVNKFSYNSPLVNRIASNILRKHGKLYSSEKYYLNSISLTDRYLDRKDRLITHKELFDIKTEVCSLCGNNEFKEVLVRADGIRIIECKKCGLAVTERMPSEKNISNIYDDKYYDSEIRGYRVAYNKINKDTMFFTRAQWINNNLDLENKEILDIGCATGEFLEEMKKYKCNCTGLEISSYGYEECINKNIKMFNKKLDKLDIDTETYDCITMWDVLEHNTDPVNELRNIYNILKLNGKLYISVPNHLLYKRQGNDSFGYNSSYEHIIYFEPDTIISMLKMIGFKIEGCIQANENNVLNLNAVESHIYICARK